MAGRIARPFPTGQQGQGVHPDAGIEVPPGPRKLLAEQKDRQERDSDNGGCHVAYQEVPASGMSIGPNDQEVDLRTVDRIGDRLKLSVAPAPTTGSDPARPMPPFRVETGSTRAAVA